MHTSKDKRGKKAPGENVITLADSINPTPEAKAYEQALRQLLRDIANRGERFEGSVSMDALMTTDYDPLIGIHERPSGDRVYSIELKVRVRADSKIKRDPRDIQGY